MQQSDQDPCELIDINLNKTKFMFLILKQFLSLL